MGSIAVEAAVDSTAANRSLSAADWAESGPQLVSDARALVSDLHRVHRPAPGTVVVGVIDQLGRVAAGASFPVAPFGQRQGGGDGWQYRNALLGHLRRIIPHDLRRTRPVRTAVLMLCRRGSRSWTAEDGAWMWALQDASVLHGLRCGAYVTLTDDGWQVLGDGRRGRTPHSGSWAHETVHTVSSLPVRALAEPVRVHSAPRAVRAGSR
jgi:hypothetical protein